MIDLHPLRLSEAAERLNVSVDSLLVAGYAERLAIFGLYTEPIHAELVCYDWIEQEEAPGFIVFASRKVVLHFVRALYLSLPNCLDGKPARPDLGMLSEPDNDGRYWRATDRASRSKIQLPLEKLFVVPNEARRYIEMGRRPADGGADIAPPPSQPQTNISQPTYMSNELVLLNRGAREWWSTADPDDPSTHPTNTAVANWFTENKLSKSLAERAASIIRPSWAHIGRKPNV